MLALYSCTCPHIIAVADIIMHHARGQSLKLRENSLRCEISCKHASDMMLCVLAFLMS